MNENAPYMCIIFFETGFPNPIQLQFCGHDGGGR